VRLLAYNSDPGPSVRGKLSSSSSIATAISESIDSGTYTKSRPTPSMAVPDSRGVGEWHGLISRQDHVSYPRSPWFFAVHFGNKKGAVKF
jgi:hypothetical protein